MEYVVTPQGLVPTAEEGSALPGASTVGRAVIGFALIGLVTALGSSGLEGATRVLPAALVVDLGALVLTGPALLVGHQYLGLEAEVTELVGVLSWVFCRAGTVALGLCPALLFFSATSGLAPSLLVLSLVGITGMALLDGYSGLLSAERAAGSEDSQRMRAVKMQGLVLFWMGLTALVGLRLGLHLGGV